MSGKNNVAKYPQSRTDTRIGAGVRVDGDISFTGVLHVQGAVLGDVSCDADIGGMLVVDQSGSVAGTLKAPHIVVGGKVSGPSYSSESIEIQAGAHIVGDTFYKEIQVHAGGVVEGWLTPRVSTDKDRLRQEQDIQIPGPPAVEERAVPHAHAASVGIGRWVCSPGGRIFGGAVVLLIVVLASVLLNRGATPNTPPVADVVLKADSSMKIAAAAPLTPADVSASPDSTRDVAADPARQMTAAETDKESIAPAPAPDLAEVDPKKIVVVQGVNPGKPAGALSVVSEGPSILFRRKRQDSSNGVRIEIPKGASTIAIAKDEVLRVAEGRNIVIFYQGRKVGPKTIEAGNWMSFVPQIPGGAMDKE